MKQYDSYLIYGCHFPKKAVEIITTNSSLRYFNNKIRLSYNCEIVEANVPISDTKTMKQYFLKICLDQSEQSILKLDQIKDLDISKFKELLELFEIDDIEPYFIGVPILRELPNYINFQQ